MITLTTLTTVRPEPHARDRLSLARLTAARRSLIRLWAGGIAATALASVFAVPSLRLALFLATLVVEVAAVYMALAGRARLARDDPGRRVWLWIGLGLGLRVVAELRLATLYLDIVPNFITDNAWAWAVYFFGLRYLYTIADLVLLMALLATRRALLDTGLDFHLRPRDALVLVLLPPLPVTVYLLQSVFLATAADVGLHTFRIVSATVGAVVSGVCVVLASPALQMGGGAWAWIWGAAALAGIARALAFAAAAVAPTFPGGILLEQALLWTFACGWLLATVLHLRLITHKRGVNDLGRRS